MIVNITGVFYLPSGVVAADRVVAFKPIDRTVRAGYLGGLVPDPVIVQTGIDGSVDFNLLTGSYFVTIEAKDTDNIGRGLIFAGKANVPDAPSASISEILDAAVAPDEPPVWYTQAIQAAEDAIDAATRAEGAAPFPDRAAAEAAHVPANVTIINVDGLQYRREPGATDLVTADGATWAQIDRKNTLDATRAPLPTDDVSQGYAPGSRWLWQGMEWVYTGTTWIKGSRVTPREFGGRPDDMAFDNGPAITAALAYLKTIGGGELHFPEGRWRKSKTSSAFYIDFPIVISGVGGARSDFFHDDDPALGRNDVWHYSGGHPVTLRDMCFSGNMDQEQSDVNASQMHTGGVGSDVLITGCTFRYARYMATSFGGCKSFIASGNNFYDCFRDGLRATQSRQVIITGNRFSRVVDDAIAVHSKDSDSAGEVKSQPMPHQVTIKDNTFFLCQGVKVLGAKVTDISNNNFRFTLRNPIQVAAKSPGPEGNTPMLAVSIKDNIIIDTFANIGITSAISILGNDATDDPVDDPQPHWWAQGTSNQPAIPTRSSNIVISGNIIGATAPRAGQFSDLGFGLLLDRALAGAGVGYLDPLLTASTWACHGIEVSGANRGLKIEGNQFFGGGSRSAIKVVLPATGKTPLDGLRISENTFRDWPSRGIVIEGAVRQDLLMDIVGNDFDLDPHFRHPDHNADGTWAQSTSVDAINTNGSANMGEISGNHFRNCSRPTSHVATLPMVPWTNFVYADLSELGLGDRAGNKGVRSINSAAGYVVVWIDGDPTSPTYGSVRGGQPPRLMASSMPTSGFYCFGHFVQCSIFDINSQSKTIIGWRRATTGSDHVLNTDWKQVVSG